MRLRGNFIIYILYFSTSIILAQEINTISATPDLPIKGICAHRGAKETHPENTISAFKEAIRLGAQMIEFDVQLSKEGELVIMHDATVDRTTNGKGEVAELTLPELKLLDAGSWKSEKFVGEKIPTLKEVLQIMPQNIWLNIHLKGNKKLGFKTAKLILVENRASQAVIACEKKAVRGVRMVNKELMICNMERLKSRGKYIAETIKKGYSFIQLKKSRDDENIKRDIQKLKEHNIIINYVQADSSDEVLKLLQNGIDFVLTDQLESMLKTFLKIQ